MIEREERAVTSVLLVTGKGGTGKTTVSAATGALLASEGARTLVVSTDAAHSLADAFDRSIGPEPVELAPLLFGLEIDPQRLLDSTWADSRRYVQDVLEWAGADTGLSSDLSVVPGLEELLALREISAQLDQGWDQIVVDCAPTAETVRLLALPTAVEHYLERVLPGHRRTARRLAPLVRRSASLPPSAPAGVLESVLALADELRALNCTLTDATVTSARLVTTPESMVLNETKRAWTYLSLYGHHVDSIVVNRLVPPVSAGPWMEQLRRSQLEQLERAQVDFAGLAQFEATLGPTEILGVDRLRALGREVYGETGAGGGGARHSAITYWESGLRIRLPGAEPDSVQLDRQGPTLHLTVASFRRSLDLPVHLHHRPVTTAELAGGELTIGFAS